VGERSREVKQARVVAALLTLVAAAALAFPGCESGVEAKMQHLRSLNNHRKHVDLHMDCSGCHTGARDEDRAHLPSIHACAQCHKPDRSYPVTSKELAGYIAREQEIPWIRMNRSPGHVYFSHVAHVELGEIKCEECHGDMNDSEHPVERPLVRTPDMFACIDCHQSRGVSVDCLTCHR